MSFVNTHHAAIPGSPRISKFGYQAAFCELDENHDNYEEKMWLIFRLDVVDLLKSRFSPAL